MPFRNPEYKKPEPVKKVAKEPKPKFSIDSDIDRCPECGAGPETIVTGNMVPEKYRCPAGHKYGINERYQTLNQN